MSDKPPMSNGKVGLLVGVSDKLISVLPPAFLLLIILNIVFLGVSAWTFQHNSDRRADMISKIVDACLLDQQRDRRQ